MTTPIDIKCPFCFSLPGVMCRVARPQGPTLNHYHQQRITRSNDPTYPKGPLMPIPAEPTKAELHARIVTLELQVRTLLQSAATSARNTLLLTETVDTLNHELRRALIARSAQMVLDFMDDQQQPAWEDVREIDEWLEGTTIAYRVDA